jgi:acyl carrier protein
MENGNSHKDILEKVQEIFRLVFNDDQLGISEVTSPDDIEKWDSISLANIIYAVEIDFKINIDSSETLNWQNVGEICNCIELKIRGQRNI